MFPENTKITDSRHRLQLLSDEAQEHNDGTVQSPRNVCFYPFSAFLAHKLRYRQYLYTIVQAIVYSWQSDLRMQCKDL